MILARNIKLNVIGNEEEEKRVYKYLRNGMKAQNKMMNQRMTDLYIEKIKDVCEEDRKELRRLYGRIPKSKKGSAYSENIEFAKGLKIGNIMQQVDKKFKYFVNKQELMDGKVSLPTYKENNPLIIPSSYIQLKKTNPYRDNGLYHEYESHQDFLDAIVKRRNPRIFIKFANDITFGIDFGSIKKSMFLRKEFIKIFEEEYQVRGSSIGFDKTGKKIILNLSIEIPESSKEKEELDENICVGVDLGIVVPAICALNNNKYVKEQIGGYEEFTGKRIKVQEKRRRAWQNAKFNKGGHGRKKKLAHLENMREHESNFARTYNHMVSFNVIKFALENHAKYINLEDLSSISKKIKDKFVLRNWSYYQLQQQIKYKAKKWGIIVRLVNPAYTSQTCSECGKIGIRRNQAEFICTNPKCKCSKNFTEKINADFNAARNISMSTDFSEIDGVKIEKEEVA